MLLAHPRVQSACVLGVPDGGQSGQVPLAVVVVVMDNDDADADKGKNNGGGAMETAATVRQDPSKLIAGDIQHFANGS